MNYDEFLEIVTSMQNIHEIIWDVDEIAGEKIEARYFNDLGYPIKLTNASGYMNYPLRRGIHIFIDGIENDGEECEIYAVIKLIKLMNLTEKLECDMTDFRRLAYAIRKQRVINNIPIKQSLQSVKILKSLMQPHGCMGSCVLSPNILNAFDIRLDTQITPWLAEEYELRKKKRKEAMRRKAMGVKMYE